MKIDSNFEKKIKKLQSSFNPQLVNSVFPGGKKQIDSVGKGMYFLSNGKIKIENIYKFYARDIFFYNTGKSIADFKNHIKFKYNDILNEKEQFDIMGFIITNVNNPHYIFDENDITALNGFIEILKNSYAAIKKNMPDSSNQEQISGAVGNFGLEKSNPIAVSSIYDEEKYLEKIELEDGTKIFWKRISSTSSDNIYGLIDVYEIYDNLTKKRVTILYICPYTSFMSEKIPVGFRKNTKILINNTKEAINDGERNQSDKNQDFRKQDININKTGKTSFCKLCGGELNIEKVCTKCGKKYFKIKHHKFIDVMIILGIIAVTIITIATLIIFSNYKKDELEKELEYKNQLEIDKIEKKAELERQKEEQKQRNIDACQKQAYKNYISWWNKTCNEKGLKEDCLLPSAIAKIHEDDRKNDENKCIQRYN